MSPWPWPLHNDLVTWPEIVTRDSRILSRGYINSSWICTGSWYVCVRVGGCVCVCVCACVIRCVFYVIAFFPRHATLCGLRLELHTDECSRMRKASHIRKWRNSNATILLQAAEAVISKSLIMSTFSHSMSNCLIIFHFLQNRIEVSYFSIYRKKKNEQQPIWLPF